VTGQKFPETAGSGVSGTRKVRGRELAIDEIQCRPGPLIGCIGLVGGHGLKSLDGLEMVSRENQAAALFLESPRL